ncbi:hypothetical protein AZ602_05025 [Moraxella sp. RCAD0137]|nr:hypothetical protein AZ602_05025 [Moraxella sp. RCAD0137]
MPIRIHWINGKPKIESSIRDGLSKQPAIVQAVFLYMIGIQILKFCNISHFSPILYNFYDNTIAKYLK